MHSQLIAGHNGYQYRVNLHWGKQPSSLYPVRDCHEMVFADNGLLYMLTNDIHNNILIYQKDGRLSGVWGNSYPGAHGLTLSEENGTEYLYITDCERHQVIKTTLTGKEVMILDYPEETGLYHTPAEYKPTETAIASNGDIYITDGYGLQVVIQYNSKGEYIRHWGGPGTFDCAHGIAIDSRQAPATLLITSRNENSWKRFTLDGSYISEIHLHGSFVCRPVIHGDNIYGAVFRSENNQKARSGYITILDKNDKVISTPGGSEPVYKNGKLLPQKQEGNIFIHPHDVCVDDEENLYIPQWNSDQTYPLKLERIQ